MERTKVNDPSTPRKSERNCRRENERDTFESMVSLTLESDKIPAAKLGDYFERSYSSSSSEESEGGWTEVHDQSESSDTGHSAQTHGTLGSAVVIDATIQAQKVSLNDSKNVQASVTPATHPREVTPRPENVIDRPPPRKKSTCTKTMKNKTIRNYATGDSIAVVQNPTSKKKKKGKKENYAKALVPTDTSREDLGQALVIAVDEQSYSASRPAPKKKKKKDKSEAGNTEGKFMKQVGDKNESLAKLSPSKKKKKKTTKKIVDVSATEAVEDFRDTIPTSAIISPSNKKKNEDGTPFG
jgi:hypothetical protein